MLIVDLVSLALLYVRRSGTIIARAILWTPEWESRRSNSHRAIGKAPTQSIRLPSFCRIQLRKLAVAALLDCFPLLRCDYFTSLLHNYSDRVYRFRCIVPYPPNSEFELELRVGDIIYVHKKRDDGWYKGTQQRTGRTGLFPASFVEAF